MKILLVRPKPHPDSVGLQSFMVCEPLELEYAAAAAQAQGHTVALADMILERRPFGQILVEVRPDLVAFTSYIVHVGVVKEFAGQVKRHDARVPTVVGGVHAEVVPQDFECETLDFVLHARALEAWAVLLQKLSELGAGEVPVSAWRGEIPGVWNGPDKPYEAQPLEPSVHPDRSLSAAWRQFREHELSQMNKRVDVETNARAVEILAKLDIECHAGIMVGPDWEPKDFQHLCRWLDRLGRPYVNIQPLTPMPGTPLFETMKDSILVPRERHELWDMTHLVVEPTRLSRRAFQWNIVKANYRSTTSLSNHWRILRRHGLSVYLRTARGSLHLTRQYLRMIRRGT